MNAEDGAPVRANGHAPARASALQGGSRTGSEAAIARPTAVAEVDMTAVARLRAEIAGPMAERGVQLTYLSLVAATTVDALRELPALNASIDGGDPTAHEEVDLGIVVPLPDGTIVPVLRGAQRLSLLEIASAIGDLTARAWERRLCSRELRGGTFTVAESGQFGATMATSIVERPRTADLNLGAIVRRPVAVPAPEGETVGIRPIASICVSWDPDAIDAGCASRFLAAVRRRLERGTER